MKNNFYRKDKIIDPTQAITLLKNKTLVFTSGVFDLLHIGHVNFLRKAKEIVGDKGDLVVVIHDDASVKSHKGKNRPINTFENRLDFISELDSVDFVIPWYGWENIAEFAVKLHPQFFAITKKSYDHSSKGEWQGESWDDIAGRVGAKIINIDILANFSSSQFERVLKDIS